MNSLNLMKDPDVESILQTLSSNLHKTLDVLLHHEMQCVDQYQDTIKDSIANYTEHASHITEFSQGILYMFSSYF